MEPREIAIDFMRNYEKIKNVLGMEMFDVDRAIKCISEFVEGNPVIMDYYDPVTVNPRVMTALLAAMYNEFVPENVREERRRIDYISKVLKQKKSGKLPAGVYDDFMAVYFSGTIDTDDLKRDGKIDFNSLALKRASEILNR